MTRILSTKTLADGTLALITTAAALKGGRTWGHPTWVRVVRLPQGMAADAYRTVRSAAEVLYSAEADARSTGPRSGMHRALSKAAAVLDALQ